MVVAEGLAKLVLHEQLACGRMPGGRVPLQDSECTQVQPPCANRFQHDHLPRCGADCQLLHPIAVGHFGGVTGRRLDSQA